MCISVKALLLRYLQRYRGGSLLSPQYIMLFTGMVVARLWWVICYSHQVVFTLQGDCRAATLLEVCRLIGLIAVTLHETLYHDNQESEYKGRYQYRGRPS